MATLVEHVMAHLMVLPDELVQNPLEMMGWKELTIKGIVELDEDRAKPVF